MCYECLSYFEKRLMLKFHTIIYASVGYFLHSDKTAFLTSGIRKLSDSLKDKEL